MMLSLFVFLLPQAQMSTPPPDPEGIWEVNHRISLRHQYTARRNFYLARGQIVVLATDHATMKVFFRAVKALGLDSEEEEEAKKLGPLEANEKGLDNAEEPTQK